ncbi:MAG: TetR/AcrR family transcriptional regulator [Lysobacterales bacterium]
MSSNPVTPTAVRQGTATREAGRNTAQRILDSARQLLAQKGHSQFSMRNVADGANLRLANVQYYFPKRQQLVEAIMADTGQRYTRAYERLIANCDDPEERLRRVLRYQIDDAFEPETRRFFIQLWALLNTIDDGSGKLLSELYAYDLDPLMDAVKAINPQLPSREIRRRATLLAGLIEGMMVVRGGRSRNDEWGHDLLESAFQLGISIAEGTATQ